MSSIARPAFNLPLVNSHTHAAMIAFRGMAEDLPLKDWLEKYIWPAEKEKVGAAFVYENTKAAIKEMRKNGIAVFNDMYFFAEEAARAAEEEKMRAVIGEPILDFPVPGSETPEAALETAEKLLVKYRESEYVSAAVAPHSIYTVCAENLVKAKELARKYGALYHIHLAETKYEFDECLEKNGSTPVGYMDSLGLLDEKTLLAHCVWLTDADMEILAARGVKVAHCPLSNLKLGSGIAPVAKMMEKGITVALGTDGAASSNRLDIWEAGKFAALLQKGITGDPGKLSAKEAVKMMTVNGMKALNINELDGKSLSDIEREIDEGGNYNYLYEMNIGELNL